MAFLIATSSSGTKPCVHHTSAVVAAALAIWGRASAPAAATATELRRIERRLSVVMLPSVVSTHCDRIFREDLLDPLEGLVRGGLRCHATSHDVDPADRPDMLVLDLRVGRI